MKEELYLDLDGETRKYYECILCERRSRIKSVIEACEKEHDRLDAAFDLMREDMDEENMKDE